jgi:hypothetical protein
MPRLRRPPTPIPEPHERFGVLVCGAHADLTTFRRRAAGRLTRFLEAKSRLRPLRHRKARTMVRPLSAKARNSLAARWGVAKW